MVAGTSVSIVSTSQIGNGVIVNADVNASAAIEESKIAFATNDGSRHDHSAADITVGTLSTTRGGTGISNPTAKGLVRAQGASAMDTIAPGTSGQVLKSDGTDWAAGSVPGPLLVADTTGAACQNTVTETTLCTVSVPANTLGTGNAVRAKCWFNQWKQNTDGDALTIRMYYGTTVVASFVFTHGAEATVEWDGYLEGILMASGATNTQEGQVEVFGHPQGGGALTALLRQYGEGTGAEDSTGALTFKITAQWNQTGAGSFPGIVVTRSLIEKLTT